MKIRNKPPLDEPMKTLSRNSIKTTGLLISLFIATLAFLPGAFAQQERVRVTVLTPAVAFPGQKINIFVETTFGGALVDATIIGPHVWKPDNSRDALPDATRFALGHFSLPYTVPNMVGTYWVHVIASANGTRNTGSASFQVNPQIPSTANLDSMNQNLMSQFSALKQSVDAAQAATQSLQSLQVLLQATLAVAVLVLVLQVVVLVRKR